MMSEKKNMRGNLGLIRTILQLVLDIFEVKVKDGDPEAVDHPLITSKYMVAKDETGADKLVNILEDTEALRVYKDELSEAIKKAKTISDINKMVADDYKISLIKWVDKYLTGKQLGDYVAENLSYIEAEENTTFLIDLIKKVEQEHRMSEKDRALLFHLADEVQVYKGINSDNDPKHSIVWSIDIKQAKWQAMRPDGEQGKVYSAKIAKPDILAYYSAKGASTVIIDCSKLENMTLLTDSTVPAASTEPPVLSPSSAAE